MDIVTHKLTKAGFIVNAMKCQFYQTEVTLLGHRINQTDGSAHPAQVEAILKYPSPCSQKQLRQFHGTCNFHHYFILNYVDYITTFLLLTKKGKGQKWTPGSQVAFENLRGQFAQNIHLTHPDEEVPCELYTDVNKFGISCILTQITKQKSTQSLLF
jgi:hypothetical protein